MYDQEIFRRSQAKMGKAPAGQGVKLGKDNGQDSRVEAAALIRIITESLADNLPQEEVQLIEQIDWQLNNLRQYQPTPKQIYWLRDIKDRLL